MHSCSGQGMGDWKKTKTRIEPTEKKKKNFLPVFFQVKRNKTVKQKIKTRKHKHVTIPMGTKKTVWDGHDPVEGYTTTYLSAFEAVKLSLRKLTTLKIWSSGLQSDSSTNTSLRRQTLSRCTWNCVRALLPTSVPESRSVSEVYLKVANDKYHPFDRYRCNSPDAKDKFPHPLFSPRTFLFVALAKYLSNENSLRTAPFRYQKQYSYIETFPKLWQR